jgi:hypothetical protein
MQIHALMIARSGPVAFDLRCLVSERLLLFSGDKYLIGAECPARK